MTLIADLLICLRFFSRLPVPATERERQLAGGGLAAAAAMTPVAGGLLALPGLATLGAALAMRLPETASAVLVVAVSLVVSGAMHEDALADCADGFGGGWTRERKLAIMRDSRIGAYGAAAIGVSLLLRASALAAAATAHRGGLALFAAAVLSRTACLLPLALLPPARADGAGAAVADLEPCRAILAWGLAAGLCAGAAAPGHVDLARTAVAVLLAGAAGLAMTGLSKRQIGGQTGDVAGATQQLAEISVLLVFAAGAA